MSDPMTKPGAKHDYTRQLREMNEALLVSSVRQHELTEQAQQAEAARRESEEKYRTLFAAIDEGFCVVEVLPDPAGGPPDYRFLEVNPAFEQHSGLADATGRRMRDLAPAHEEFWYGAYAEVAETGEPRRFQHEAAALGRHFDVYAFRLGPPHLRRVAVLFTDITRRLRTAADLAAVAARDAFRVTLGDLLRPLTDPAAIRAVAARLLAAHLSADRAFYAEMGADGDEVVVAADARGDGVGSVVGRHRLTAFGRAAADALRAGRTLVYPDVVAAADLSADERAAYHTMGGVGGVGGVGAAVTVPLMKGGRLVAFLGVHSIVPRGWTAGEVRLVEELGERTWAAVEQAKAEAALRESEGRLAAVFRQAAVGICEIGPDGQFRWANDELGRILGRPADELPAAGVADVTHPDDRPASLAAFGRVLATGERVSLDKRYVRPDGAVVWANSTLTRLDRPGQPPAVLAVTADLTARRQAEAALRESEERFRGLAEAVPAVVWSSTDGDPDYYNARWYAYTGLTPDASGGEEWHRVIHPDDRPRALELAARSAATGAEYDVEYRLRRHDGEYRWHIGRSRRVPALGRWFGTAADVHDLKTAQEAARASEDRLQAVAANLPNAAVFVVGPDLRYRLAEGQVLRDVGKAPADFEGKTLAEAVPPELLELHERTYGQVLAGEPFRFEQPVGDRHFIHHGAPLRDAAGRVTAALAVSYDITDRVRAEEALRASEERFRGLFESMDQGYCIIELLDGPNGEPDHDYRFLEVNPAFVRQTGLPDAVGRTIRELAPGVEPHWFAFYAGVARTGRPERREGLVAAMGRWFDIYAARQGGPGSRRVAVLFTDITARKRAEDALRASEERFRLLVENVRDHAIVALDPLGMVAGWNVGAERLLGYTEAEVVGLSAAAFFTPEDRAAGLPERELAEAAATDRAGDDNWLLHKDGSRFWASGATTAVRDPAGRLTGFVKIFRDLTERRAAEEAVRQGREQLRLALEAASMGIWRWDVAGDAHVRDPNMNRLLGLPAVESTRTLGDLLARVHPDDRAGVAAGFDQTVRHGRNLSVEFRVVWPDGTVRWLRDQGDVFGGTAGGRFLTGAAMDVTELKEAEAGLRRANDALEERVQGRTAELAEAVAELQDEAAERRTLQGRLVVAQEQERTRIARELHDSLGQYLAGMTLALTALRTSLPGDDPARPTLDRLIAVTNQIGHETHRLAVRLRPTALDDVGLWAAVQNAVETFQDQAGIPAEFEYRGPGADDAPEPAATAIYRAVQEALTNVLKHARASRVSVVLERQPAAVVAIVEDDGRGFDPAAAAAGGRLGLVGMRERAALAGGTVQVESAPGAGTTVFVRVPIGRPEGGR